MSNTWEYRFAFKIGSRQDVPEEFLNIYDEMVHSHGPVISGLFTPALEEGGRLLARWVPPKLILLFKDVLTVLALDIRSNQVLASSWRQEEFLGYGMADFMLRCWFSIYPGEAQEPRTVVAYPSTAVTKFEEFASELLHWCSQGLSVPGENTRGLADLEGLPMTFGGFLRAHLGLDEHTACFFQPTIQHHKKLNKGIWPNLLMLSNSARIVILSDQRGMNVSLFGMEMTYLPLAHVTSVGWTPGTDIQASSIYVNLQSTSNHLRLSWHVFEGLQPYAISWVRTVENTIQAHACT